MGAAVADKGTDTDTHAQVRAHTHTNALRDSFSAFKSEKKKCDPEAELHRNAFPK